MSINKPRWVILLLDMIIVILAFSVSYILIFKHRGGVEVNALRLQLILVSVLFRWEHLKVLFIKPESVNCNVWH